MPNCVAISSTRAAPYPRSAKCRIAASTIRARFASERGRGFPSRFICVGFARLLVIPSIAQLPQQTPKDKHDFSSRYPENPDALDLLQLTRRQLADYTQRGKETGINHIGFCCGQIDIHARETARVSGQAPRRKLHLKKVVANQCQPTKLRP